MPYITPKKAKKLKMKDTTLQTILIPKEYFNKFEAKIWLKNHNFKNDDFRETKEYFRFMQNNPIIGANFYSKTLNNNIILVFQINKFNNKGYGLMEDIINKTKKIMLDVSKRLEFKKRKEGLLPPQSRDLLENIKNEKINSIKIIRTPLESYINNLLNVLSLGKWKKTIKNIGYDKLFHLSLFINDKYNFHKIEVPTLKKENPIKNNSSILNIDNVDKFNININEFINKTRNFLGDIKFSEYDPKYNNCQDFIYAALEANNLINEKYKNFIKQDAISIFENNPSFLYKLSKSITDIGAVANKIIEGEAINNNDKKKKFSMYLNEQINTAKKLNIPVKDIIISPIKKKKYRIILKDNSYIDYGHVDYEDFLQHKDQERRKKFLKRWSNNKNINNPNSPVFYITRLNW